MRSVHGVNPSKRVHVYCVILVVNIMMSMQPLDVIWHVHVYMIARFHTLCSAHSHPPPVSYCGRQKLVYIHHPVHVCYNTPYVFMLDAHKITTHIATWL